MARFYVNFNILRLALYKNKKIYYIDNMDMYYFKVHKTYGRFLFKRNDIVIFILKKEYF